MKNKYISRLRSGWQLRIATRLQQYFADTKYGGKSNALIAAKAKRDEYLKSNDLTHKLNGVRFWDNSERNKSGVVGLFIAGENKQQSYIATYFDNGTQKTKWFSFSRFGKEYAFVAACRFRYEHTKCLVITNKNKLPIKIDRLRLEFKHIVDNSE